MDLRSYCDTADKELSDWKGKLDQVIRQINQLPEKTKARLGRAIRDLETTIKDIDFSINKLNRECLTNWSQSQGAVEDKMSNLRKKMTDLCEKMDGPLIGKDLLSD
jgi:chromosome segregation ATPase